VVALYKLGRQLQQFSLLTVDE